MNRTKWISLAVMTGVAGSLLAGCGSSATQEAETSAHPAKKIRIFTTRSDAHPARKVWEDIIKQYQTEVNPNFSVEYETVPNSDQYFNKLKLYIAGNDLPDIFQTDSGLISEQLASEGKLVNIEEELKAVNMYDVLNPAAIDYVSHQDGGLYILPEARYGNAIFFWTEPFKKYGLEKPKTFDDLLQVAETLKANGEIPLGVSGKVSWNILHLLYLPSWRVTANEWLDQVKTGQEKLANIPTAMEGARMIHTMGKNGYFPPGFGNIEFTDIINGFLGGQYAMAYLQSTYFQQMSEDYQAGKLDYFLVPDAAGVDNPYANTITHTGQSYAFNQKTYDEEMKSFFRFLISRYHETCYKYGLYSPFDLEIPQGQTKLMQDFYQEMIKQKNSWSNWDQAFDPVTAVATGDLAKQLAMGMITPEQFVNGIDESIAKNAQNFFKQ